MKTGVLAQQSAKENPANLLNNGSLEVWTAGTTAAPDGWVAELTPGILRDTGDTGYGSYSAKITAVGAGVEGIKYSLAGLKASTVYTVSIRTKVTAGDTSQMLTTGAGVNMVAVESTSATFETKIGSFTTDGSGTTVVLKLTAKADTDIV